MFKNNSHLHPLLFNIIALTLIMTSCSKYYKPVAADITTPDKLQMAVDTNADRYFILRQGNKFYSLSEVKVDIIAQQLSGYVDVISTDHLTYIQSTPRKYGNSQAFVENEAHIYSTDTTQYIQPQNIVLPFSSIAMVEIIERDKKRTTKSGLITTGALLGGFFAGIAIIASTFTYNLDWH